VKLAIMDTSSILFGFSHGKNAFDAVRYSLRGYAPYISGAVLHELRRISTNKGRLGAAAGVALQELRYKNIKCANKSLSNADLDIIRVAEGHKGSAVITNDTELVHRLLGAGVDVFKLSISGRLMRVLR
jgi:rRNA-processing protein FCF1